MATPLAVLRLKIENELRGRVPAPFTYRDRNVFEVVSSGVPEIDRTVGGLPRGAMTEIYGPPCSGRTSLLISALASRTARGEVCALVDARDSFDPETAVAAGVALKQLLWMRCRDLDKALHATDLLIQSGGFGMVAVDLSDVAAKTVRQVPLNAWFRFRRAVEDTPTILMVLGQESSTKTCASLVLRLEARQARWSKPLGNDEAEFLCWPFARLLQGVSIEADVIRSRIQQNVVAFPKPDGTAANCARPTFDTRMMWSDYRKGI